MPEPLLVLGTGFGLVLLSLVSEDAATVGGAALARTGLMPSFSAFAFCFLGIWLGDLGLYAAARRMGRPLLGRWGLPNRLSPERIARSEAWFARHGPWALILCRFVPGTRLPTYLAAGLLRMPVAVFGLVTGLIAGAWVGLVFLLVHLPAARAAVWLFAVPGAVWQAAAGALGLMLLWRWAKRCPPWEFWPAWLFYLPVAMRVLWLGVRHRGLTVPTVANPGMFTGGIIGESKMETLRELRRTAPEWTPVTALITAAKPKARWEQFDRILGEEKLSFPLVLKPDVAQRGRGFKVVRDAEGAREYLARVEGPVLAQAYVAGPEEAGIFYYRFPHETRGRIFAITQKVFPVITGDGVRKVEELILRDPRASLMAGTYLRRWERRRKDVLAAGETLRLVEAGNHAQGCIFRDGRHLWSEALEARIDGISRRVQGFCIGRYDVRYASDEALRRGEAFQILELNGASSEATSIYDARNSLGSAYRTLYRQWELVFAIGAANRALGHRPVALATLWREWRAYRKRSRTYPPAD